MTNIINVDLEKIIESSISELTKKLSSELNKKVREDVINNLMKTTTTKSIYGLDDIKDFGKIDCTDKYLDNHYHRTYLKLKNDEYPILYYTIGQDSSQRSYYITNIIDDLILDNDDIMFLSLFSLGTRLYYNAYGNIYPGGFKFSHGSSITTNFIQENKLMGNNIGDGCHAILHDDLLKKSLKCYFASVHDNKIKGFEFDKLLKNYKELEISINNNKKELDESKEIIIDLEDKNKNLEEEIIKQSKKLKEIKEIEILNLEEEYNKLFTVFTETKDDNNKIKEELNKTKDENIKLSDEWLILKDETIKKFEEDNYKLRMEKDKLVKNNNELKKELGKIIKENNNVNSK